MQPHRTHLLPFSQRRRDAPSSSLRRAGTEAPADAHPPESGQVPASPSQASPLQGLVSGPRCLGFSQSPRLGPPSFPIQPLQANEGLAGRGDKAPSVCPAAIRMQHSPPPGHPVLGPRALGYPVGHVLPATRSPEPWAPPAGYSHQPLQGPNTAPA